MSASLLNRAALQSEVEAGRLAIEPFDPSHLRPASYVLRLGRRFRRWRDRGATPLRVWSPGAADAFLDDPFEDGEVVIAAGEFMLACTAEAIGLPPDRWASVSPLSHVARFGLGVHCGADFVNPGFGAGAPTPLALELFNHNRAPLALTAGMPIAHLRVSPVEASAAAAPSIYERRDPVGAPRFHEEMAPVFGPGAGG